MNSPTDKQVDNISQPLVETDVQTTRPVPAFRASIKITVMALLGATILAEIITMFVSIVPGVILYGLLLLVTANLSYFSKESATRRLYLAYTLVPLLRILSLAMPVQLVTLIYRYVMVGVPLLVSTTLVMQFNGLPGLRRNLSGMEWVSQTIIGISGIALGIIAYVTLSPPPDIMIIHPWYMILSQLIVLTLFGAVTEEIIFRGLLQKAFNYPFGSLSIILTSIIYASMFFGTHSWAYIAFYGIIGLLFSFWVQVSDSLWGVIVAHSLMNIVFLLLIYLR